MTRRLIDFHSHILPGIDDGSADLACSVEMLQQEAEQGVTHVVCTPHFYAHHDRPEVFLSRRARAEEALRREMSKHSGLPELFIGAEVFYFRGISDSDFLNRLTIGKKPCIMIEMAGVPFHRYVYDELETIYTRFGITPIIAHIDRYISPWRTYGIPDRLMDLPVLVQANADFFLRKRTSAMAMKMLRADQIHLLGSDCHNMDTRCPNLGPAAGEIAKRLGTHSLDRVSAYAHHVLDLSD